MRLVGLLAFSVGVAACHHGGGAEAPDATGAAGATAGGTAGAGLGDAGPGDASVDGQAGAPEAGADALPPPRAPAGLDPGFVGIRRLTDAEYDNTMTDLLGVPSDTRHLFGPVSTPADAIIDGFDDLADGLAMSPERYRWYFASASTLADAAFADATLRGRIVTCAPASPANDACAGAILRAFARRAWRRPPADAEVADLVALVRAAEVGGAPFEAAVEQAVVAVLASDSFLYRIELDGDPNVRTAHALTPYEVASRLSYLLWSTTPDDTLLALAGSGALWSSATLRQQVGRLLASPRADGFVRNFMGQWLSFRALDAPPLDRAGAVDWTQALQAAAGEEARRFASMFLDDAMTLPDLLRADVNFVDGDLAAIYGVPAPAPGTALARVSIATDARKGYLGLVAPLTLTAHPASSSTAFRGLWVREHLLCGVVAPPPDPSYQVFGDPREQATSVLGTPACATCHSLMDPIGLGLEDFDEIGAVQIGYPNDPVPIDGKGSVDGVAFQGVIGLADLLAHDHRFWRCAGQKALTYALGRSLAPADAPAIDRVEAALEQGGLTMHAMLEGIVVDDLFRFRRGEGAP